MKIVTVVEMQSRLCETLARQGAELTQVTYQGTPVVAVLDLEHYQTFQTAVQSDHSMMKVEVTSESLTQGQHFFHSYRKCLAPRLESHEQHVVKVIELTRRKKLVGVFLAWQDWQCLVSFLQQDEERQTHDNCHLTVVDARNHLLKLVEQFACEEQQGFFAPVRVSKQRQEEPVMVIVPWGWFERVTSFLRTQHVPFTRMERDGAFQRRLCEFRSSL